MARVTVTLTMNLTGPDGAPLAATAAEAAGHDAESAIRNRLFGAGFLPDDIEAESYSVTVETKPAQDRKAVEYADEDHIGITDARMIDDAESDREFAFDVKLFGVFRVRAENETDARTKVRDILGGDLSLDHSMTTEPVTLSDDGEPELVEVDGEAV